MISNYQLAEVSLGSIYFVLVYIVGSYIIQGGLNMLDVIATSIIFAIWFSMTKVVANYVQFARYDK